MVFQQRKLTPEDKQKIQGSGIVTNGVINQVRGTCYAAACAKAMRDALHGPEPSSDADEWMQNIYFRLSRDFGGEGADTFHVLWSACSDYGLNYCAMDVSDAVGWLGVEGVGMVIRASLSQEEGAYFTKKSKGHGEHLKGDGGWNHAMTIVGASSAGKYSIQNSWGSSWGDNGKATVTWEWLCGGGCGAFKFIKIARNGEQHRVNAHAGNGVAGARAKVGSYIGSAGHADALSSSARASFRAGDVSAIARAAAFETGLECKYIGAHATLKCDTGVEFSARRVEMSFLGFGFKIGQGGFQMSNPFGGVTLGDASTFQD